MYSVTFVVQKIPKSLNKSLGSHYYSRHKDMATWRALVSFAVGSRTPPAPLSRASIRIVRHSHRMLDYDGLVGSMKPVVDALIDCGVIVDDSWKVTGPWHVTQVFRPKKDGAFIEVSVSEVD